MSMNCKVYYNDLPCGTLSVCREGLYTVFTAECDFFPGILRLWLGSYPLGVMERRGSVLSLRKRLSKAQLSAVPGFEYAVLSPDKPAAKPTVSGWISRGDGTLINDEFIAIPAELRRTPPGIRLEVIAGRQYLLFRY